MRFWYRFRKVNARDAVHTNYFLRPYLTKVRYFHAKISTPVFRAVSRILLNGVNVSLVRRIDVCYKLVQQDVSVIGHCLAASEQTVHKTEMPLSGLRVLSNCIGSPSCHHLSSRRGLLAETLANVCTAPLSRNTTF